ncbi:Ni,Fe-hydrogenase III large subunit [Sphingomonas aerolata]|nr:Ni,Fe-hydrogenase III large subunit [Sphingomonas aerolata]
MKPDRYEWLNGERERVADEDTGARHVSDVYAELLMRAGSVMVAMLLIIVVLQALPQTPEGLVQPRAALITGIILAAFSSAVLHWLKPARIMAKWALGTTLGMGCLLLLIGTPT